MIGQFDAPLAIGIKDQCGIGRTLVTSERALDLVAPCQLGMSVKDKRATLAFISGKAC